MTQLKLHFTKSKVVRLRSLYSFLALAFGTGAVWGQTPSKVLIAPIKKSAISQAPSIEIANYLAQELDSDGRIAPVVWSMTDPIFRQAAISRTLGSTPDIPTREKAFQSAHSLGANYLVLYSSQVTGKQIEARVDVYHSGREVWHDVQTMGSNEAGKLSGEDTNRSIAHTWALLMFGSPFKAMTPHPKVTTPAPTKGQQPVSAVTIPLPDPDGSTNIQRKVDELKKLGKIDQAIALTRDSIDADPFNSKLRMLLVSLYEGQKNWVAAAEVAKRGSEVIPDNLDLRKAEVRNLIASGNVQEVRDQLNEFIARDPHSENSLLIQAQTYLFLGDYSKAVQTLDDLIKKFPQPSAYYWRALCRSTLGGTEGMDADIQEFLKSPGKVDSAVETCKESEQILQSVTQKDIDLTLRVYQQAGINPNASVVRDELDQLKRDATARGGFLQQISGSPGLHESYGDLLLAQKLLLVSFVSMNDVLKTGSDDSMVDARINLGEAIKSLKSSKQKLAAELGETGLVKLIVDFS